MQYGIVYISGGARSGKSCHAENLALALHEQEKLRKLYYLASARIYDAEFGKRIAAHQSQRHSHFCTIEEDRYPSQSLQSLPDNSIVLWECVTTWLGNLWHDEHDFESLAQQEIKQVEAIVQSKKICLLIVSNELGMGIVATDPRVRAFVDAHGRLNQLLSHSSLESWFLTSGLALPLKQLGAVQVTPHPYQP